MVWAGLVAGVFAALCVFGEAIELSGGNSGQYDFETVIHADGAKPALVK